MFGWYIGLQFDPQAVRTMDRFTPALVGLALVMMAVSAVLGVILATLLLGPPLVGWWTRRMSTSAPRTA
jgi:uncharacterized membrane protein AbrB (regulator of aidB expression)